ncbi:unnamed protein product [Phytophthora fragariaefolia]|uniref:Unnamed protein product n=1 Tax=Phytophthora fragariaefolia TaxID=1490495 RepID=A0A9W6WWK2_9STRA|nr:unnamed protein product [Phytophthora fragariaefolia]
MNNPQRPREPESFPFLAAVALFDISGFSSLGSRLSEDEHRQNRDTNSSTSNNSTGVNASPAPTSPLTVGFTPALGRQSLSSASRSSSGTKLHNEMKATKSRSLQPCSFVPGNISSSSHRELSARRDLSARSSMRVDDETSLKDDDEDICPSDKMRTLRQNGAPFSSSSSSMGFVHSSRSSIATQGIAVETLTTVLNKSLEPVINVILKHKGDIIKFAGDALIVMWETEASRGKVTPAGELVYRAVCCALEALHALEVSTRVNDEHDNEHSYLKLLGMHVGIGASEMSGNHVGGVLNRWEFYLSGDANRQMGFAEEIAKKGQLALSPEAFDALEERFGTLPELDIVSHKSGNYLVQEVPGDTPTFIPQRISIAFPVREPTAELIGYLRCYVPGAIVSHLQKGLTLTPCRLNVTVAFLKLEGVIEIKDEQKQLQTIHHNLCTIQECAYKAQGMLRQFVIDDKGAIAIVAIGLPPFFHENNGENYP